MTCSGVTAGNTRGSLRPGQARRVFECKKKSVEEEMSGRASAKAQQEQNVTVGLRSYKEIPSSLLHLLALEPQSRVCL